MIDEIKNFQELNLKKYPTIIKVNTISVIITQYIVLNTLDVTFPSPLQFNIPHLVNICH